jgi:hypothetical protein
MSAFATFDVLALALSVHVAGAPLGRRLEGHELNIEESGSNNDPFSLLGKRPVFELIPGSQLESASRRCLLYDDTPLHRRHHAPRRNGLSTGLLTVGYPRRDALKVAEDLGQAGSRIGAVAMRPSEGPRQRMALRGRPWDRAKATPLIARAAPHGLMSTA